MDKTLHAIPKAISRYRVDNILGSGAMGVVYQGFDPQIERTVAIKVLHPHLRNGEHGADLEQRFIQEARAAARCLHPNIVTIFDFGSASDGSFIVMEYVAGIELKAHLRSNTFIPLPSATDICIQVLQALGHAHEHGVVHRDIKPANIILLENGNVKVSDFGVARLDTSDLTSTGFMVGTPNYMSPEGLQGHAVDARSDLYSVGVLFYELLTRQRPVREAGIEETLHKLNDITSLSGQNVRSIKPILRRALASRPEERFQNAAEFIASLKGIEDMDLTLATTTLFPAPQNYRQDVPVPQETTSASQWSDDLLVSLEQSLAKYIGPVAKVLVKKQSRSAGSMEALVNSLIVHIPNDAERSQFIKAMERTGVSSAGLSQSAAAPAATEKPASTAPALAPAVQEKLTQLLAFHIGPLASRVMQKTLKATQEPAALLQQLARHIPDEKERKQFLDQANRLL